MRNTVWVAGTVGLLLSTLAGCSQTPQRILVPSMDPEGAAAKALAEYDIDMDGAIAGDELGRCPGIKAGLSTIDKDHDGRVTAAEIADRVRVYQKLKAGLLHAMVTVYLDGSPLEGATVTLVPETFMGPAILPAKGKTNAGGACQFQTEGMDVPGAQCGIFRVQVSKAAADGRELVPSRYNAESILGADVATDSPIHGQGLDLQLKSKL